MAVVSSNVHCVLLCSGINSTAFVELTKPEAVAEVTNGVEVNLRCHATGNPEPSIEWYRNRNRSVTFELCDLVCTFYWVNSRLKV